MCLLAFCWPFILSWELPEDQGCICSVHKCQHTDGRKWGLSIPMKRLNRAKPTLPGQKLWEQSRVAMTLSLSSVK